MKLFVVLFVLGLSATGSAGQSRPNPIQNKPAIAAAHRSSADDDYAARLRSIQTRRQYLAGEYLRATDKNAVLAAARKSFVDLIIDEIFPVWYGTDWDFYGTTETPGRGQIACGYFVTTVLRDAGLRVQRVSLGQQASENIIKSLTTSKFIKRYRNAGIRDFVEDVREQGEGLYLVGLDFHVGFLVNDGMEVWFIHSSYIEPSEVIRESALESPILSSSKYRVLGRISADDHLILKWLKQTSIQTYRR